MIPQDKLALSIKELIAISGISRTSIYNEIKLGRLVVRKLGRRTVVLVSDTERWLAACGPKAVDSHSLSVLSFRDAPGAATRPNCRHQNRTQCRVYLARHGWTAWGRRWRTDRPADDPVSGKERLEVHARPIQNTVWPFLFVKLCAGASYKILSV
jgi:predicted DNA-binding transcriptional regulator AlpA